MKNLELIGFTYPPAIKWMKVSAVFWAILALFPIPSSLLYIRGLSNNLRAINAHLIFFFSYKANTIFIF